MAVRSCDETFDFFRSRGLRVISVTWFYLSRFKLIVEIITPPRTSFWTIKTSRLEVKRNTGTHPYCSEIKHAKMHKRKRVSEGVSTSKDAPVVFLPLTCPLININTNSLRSVIALYPLARVRFCLMAAAKTFFDLSALSIAGEMINFSRYAGKVVLVENTASA